MEEMREIQIHRIRPNHRLMYEDETILSLCNDIQCRGLQEPIVVELVQHWFQIIDGEKRWRACKKLGWSRVKVLILEDSIT